MDKKPNILLILTDQHRLSAVGAYGPTPCQTPHIDRLASEGLRFETVYTTCPVMQSGTGFDHDRTLSPHPRHLLERS